jgi:hypothetical protein
MTKDELKAIRAAVADYMWSEGCSCCEDTEAHGKHRETLAKLLKVPKRDDWHDFSKYRSPDRGVSR